MSYIYLQIRRVRLPQQKVNKMKITINSKKEIKVNGEIIGSVKWDAINEMGALTVFKSEYTIDGVTTHVPYVTTYRQLVNQVKVNLSK